MPSVSFPIGSHKTHTCEFQAVVPGVWYHTASASPLRRTGHGRVIRMLGVIADGGVALRLWGRRSRLDYNTGNNSLIIGIYPVANARRHVLIVFHAKIISLHRWQVLEARWRFVPDQNRLVVVLVVWYHAASASPFLTNGSLPGV